VLRVRLEPREWQRRALLAWIEAGYRGVVEVVTGGGKTVFAELCASRVPERPELRFVVVVPTQALVDQWFVSLQDEVGLRTDQIGTWSGEGRPDNAPLFNLMVINTARWAAPSLAARFPTMLIVDECHRAGSPTNAQALTGAHVATLGMSATPWREYDDAFDEIVSPALGPVVFSYGVDDARADGIVSPFDLINVGVQMLPDESKEYENLTARIRRAHHHADEAEGDERIKALLLRRGRVSARAAMRVPVTVKLVDRHRGARTLVFHEEVAPAERIYRRLLERGHSATIYHSKIAESVRRDNLRLFRQGVFDVLVSCRALDEGVNIPEAQVAIIAAASASERQRIQRLGRVLRPAPEKEAAVIYTLYATEVEERRLASEAATLESAESVTWQRVVAIADG
jgi:superfamily II DNA or RNA helicase